MKGIVLAGGKGTRLYPLTHGISKQLLPVYDKPMVYYPLDTLKRMGIVDILVIVSDVDQLNIFKAQLKDGSDYGLNIQYKIQESPRGLPDAFLVGEEFIGNDDVTLVLGDNIIISNSDIHPTPNTIFTYKVKNPQAYGVALIDDDGFLVDLVEKPTEYISDNAVIGLYTFTNKAVQFAKDLKPSKRGELEITDLIKEMDKNEGVNVYELDGFWFDCGNKDDLLDCANLIRAIQHRTNKIIGLHE